MIKSHQTHHSTGHGSVCQFCFYVPATHLETVKAAVFAAGAGHIGNYDCCCWQTTGAGQFRPLSGSTPCTGEIGRHETITEVKVEMVCARQKLAAVVKALKKAHPYETPAFMYWPVKGVEISS